MGAGKFLPILVQRWDAGPVTTVHGLCVSTWCNAKPCALSVMAVLTGVLHAAPKGRIAPKLLRSGAARSEANESYWARRSWAGLVHLAVIYGVARSGKWREASSETMAGSKWSLRALAALATLLFSGSLAMRSTAKRRPQPHNTGISMALTRRFEARKRAKWHSGAPTKSAKFRAAILPDFSPPLPLLPSLKATGPTPEYVHICMALPRRIRTTTRCFRELGPRTPKLRRGFTELGSDLGVPVMRQLIKLLFFFHWNLVGNSSILALVSCFTVSSSQVFFFVLSRWV